MGDLVLISRNCTLSSIFEDVPSIKYFPFFNNVMYQTKSEEYQYLKGYQWYPQTIVSLETPDQTRIGQALDSPRHHILPYDPLRPVAV